MWAAERLNRDSEALKAEKNFPKRHPACASLYRDMIQGVIRLLTERTIVGYARSVKHNRIEVVQTLTRLPTSCL